MAQRPEPRYAHKEVRQVAEWLKSLGFVFDDIDASDHPIFVWPATGQRIKLPGTPRGHVWKDNARKEAAAIAGVDITNKRNATAVKERANAERERAKAAQDKRRHDALAALAGKERARRILAERAEVARRVADRERELEDIARLMRRRPGGAA